MLKPSRSKRFLHRLMALAPSASTVEVEAIPLTCPGLPEAFWGAKIAVVADVHLPDAMVSTPKLLRCVAAQRPDAIFLPGDLTNSYTDMDTVGLQELVSGLVAIAPCFAIPGNHELRLNREPVYGRILTASGVTYLQDSYGEWQRGDSVLPIYGMARKRPAPLDAEAKNALVLAHKPDHFRYYAAAGWRVVVSGHAHGGQIRIGKQGIYSPGQGVLPTYTNGVYKSGNTTMVVSRGLGNSSVPFRFNNAAHLPVLILQKDPRE